MHPTGKTRSGEMMTGLWQNGNSKKRMNGMAMAVPFFCDEPKYGVAREFGRRL